MDTGSADEPDRREPTTTRIEIDPDPRLLRDSIEQLDGALAQVDYATARRVRLLVTEVVARSSEARLRPDGAICLEVNVRPSGVRIEASGEGLRTPGESEGSAGRRGPLFPHWTLDDLADRWGLDRRASGPAMWFEVRSQA